MKKIALIGNPNTGKTSLFNILTGLRQTTGNYPGVTVDKKSGIATHKGERFEIIDLPGTYSLEPHSKDEEIVLNELLTLKEELHAIIYIADARNLRRNLFLFSQIKDLGYSTLLVINRADKLDKLGLSINTSLLEGIYNCPVRLISVISNSGITELKDEMIALKKAVQFSSTFKFNQRFFDDIGELKSIPNHYWAWILIHQSSLRNLFDPQDIKQIESLEKLHSLDSDALLKEEAEERYTKIDQHIKKVVSRQKPDASISNKIDRIITHKYLGYFIFLSVLFFMFQSIYSWSSIPMDFIDSSFGSLSSWAAESLPPNRISQLVSQAIIPGVGGVVIFIPQIAILFGFISILEQSGYMSRVVFIMDKFMRKFGLNGKSIVPLISGIACAIPAIMAARNIDNPKERLITILVTPFMTCAARLPVYTILIALMVPSSTFYGFNLQGVVLMFMYLLGFLTSITASIILHKYIKDDTSGHFIIEMPTYQWPQLSNIIYTLVSKTKTFVFEAGKMILAVSVIIWVLASYGPRENFNNAESIIKQSQMSLNDTELEDAIAAYKLEQSYLGYLGRGIEPVIRPLGYDWKIGVGILTSFLAREVFVGTMASLYSVGSKVDEENTVLKKLKEAKNPKTGQPTYTFAVSLSLLMFYAFAMQCVSTIAIVKRETNSWKWPILQTVVMTGLAYIVALITYQLFN